ncbi:MAG: lysophospholipid acyltransferase family protein [Casimicrobiaceae bacterium]
MKVPLTALRVSAKLVQGLYISQTIYRRADPAGRRALNRRWSSELLRIAGIDVRAIGFPEQTNRPVTLVANHVSWADIFALNTVRACHFIAKRELRQWPIVGRLLENVGTVFIDRSDRRETHRLGSIIHDLMAASETVAVFPEGTTSRGDDVLKFHASLLEPVVAVGGEVWVVAIRYLDRHDRWTDAAAYIGEMTLIDSLRALARAGPVTAELRFLEAIDCRGLHRRAVAERAEALVRAAIREPEAVSARLNRSPS